ncbi:MAG: hypothetical protein J2P25_14715 [Nocardiopsaceae bacterium]|nr:hypothetical protein [Nocardiopsaceae bacterium]
MYSDMLAASRTFESQAPVFRAIIEYDFMAFQGYYDNNLSEAMQTFFQTLETAQQAIAEGIHGHGVKLKLAHDTYDRSETATTMSAQGLFQALKNPDIIQ